MTDGEVEKWSVQLRRIETQKENGGGGGARPEKWNEYTGLNDHVAYSSLTTDSFYHWLLLLIFGHCLLLCLCSGSQILVTYPDDLSLQSRIRHGTACTRPPSSRLPQPISIAPT